MSRARVTIVDLARELGLSKTTVSDALQGRGQVAATTRERVREAADRLGYVQNRAARSLRTRTLGAIGLYVPPRVRSFAFYMEFAMGAVRGAAALDADLVLFARDQEHAPRPFAVDGAIVVDPLPDDPILRLMAEQRLPVVAAGRPLGDPLPQVDAVIEAPHARLLRAVLDDLRAAGRRRPALLAWDRDFASSWSSDVQATYRAWCAEHDVDVRLQTLPVSSHPHELRAAVEALVTPEVDALLCAPQSLAGRSRATLLRLGRDIGADLDLVSLVGDPTTEIGEPAITCVDVDPTAFGHEAALLLGEVLAGRTGEAPVHREHAGRVRRSARLRAVLGDD
ncbi:LacI family DNA-binding transcriptional regulator [Patulibacter sp. SYSU D01012]|uniref:LacI family DNA-binding transcriptional regulator n=1 Tax=Patulibacter sp. SYSU D01012 TaxID=2817381 RepID=UPI001B304B85|nr:LacI family DNA-binding transcriptional regulator [Patulibacter sp. SYSU D01012]